MKKKNVITIIDNSDYKAALKVHHENEYQLKVEKKEGAPGSVANNNPFNDEKYLKVLFFWAATGM